MNQFERSLLRYYSKEQLNKVRKINIGIGGAGGIGSTIAVILARSGFRSIEIIDFDKIEISNLNRQQYFIDEIGLNKVDVLKKRLISINPDIKITSINKKWAEAPDQRLLQDCEIAIECFDKAEDKRAFVEYYKDKAKFVVCSNGMAGLDTNKTIKTRRINNIIIVGDEETGTEDGHLPFCPRVSMCASLMAETVLDLALNGF